MSPDMIQIMIPFVEWSAPGDSSSSPSQPTKAVSFHFLPELDALVVVLSNGDIEQINSPDAEDANSVSQPAELICHSPLRTGSSRNLPFPDF